MDLTSLTTSSSSPQGPHSFRRSLSSFQLPSEGRCQSLPDGKGGCALHSIDLIIIVIIIAILGIYLPLPSSKYVDWPMIHDFFQELTMVSSLTSAQAACSILRALYSSTSLVLSRLIMSMPNMPQYFAFMLRIMPWLHGWSLLVVFGGINSILTLNKDRLNLSAEQLSTKRRMRR